MPNGNPYYNIDWLEDESLGLPDDVVLDVSGQPIGTPDIENLMLDFLVEDDLLSFDDTYVSDEEGASDDTFSGEDIWSRSGAAGVIAYMDNYNQFKEKNKKRSTIANISQSLNKIDAAQRLSETKTRAIQSATGKAGCAGSGHTNKAQEAQYGDVSRTVKGMTGDIKKSILGYTSDIHKLRNQHIDDTWALYSDWLSLDPERYTETEEVIYDGVGGGDIIDSSDISTSDEYVPDNSYEQVINDQMDDWNTLNEAMLDLGIMGGGTGLTGWEDDALQMLCMNRPDLCSGTDYDILNDDEEDVSTCYNADGTPISPPPYGCPGHSPGSDCPPGQVVPPWGGECV